MNARSRRHRLLEEGLEASRVEVVRRLNNRGLPYQATAQRLVIVDDPKGTGWSSEWRDTKVSSLRSTQMLIAIRDESVPGRMLGLTDQLLPLAQYLERTTDLGKRPANFLPNATGTDAILGRYLAPLATHYLQQLRSVGRPRPSLVATLASELDLLCDPSAVVHRTELAVGGMKLLRAITYRGVTLRPLSPLERGAFLEAQEPLWSSDVSEPEEFVPPRPFDFHEPTALLSTESIRNRVRPKDESRLAQRVALAFFLSGVDISSDGVLVNYDRPRWAAVGFAMGYSPFPVSKKFQVPGSDRLLTPREFRTIVDLAHEIPPFGGEESSGHDIVLFRVLRGAGMHWQTSGFLDFAIALEAALLGGIQDELAYRFSLYGALFLRGDFDPGQTFGRLKRIYDVRSRLVHGSPVSSESRTAAEQDAAELAKAVTRRAVLQGWPDRVMLDREAMRLNPAATADLNRRTQTS
jgi:hypothetical protein